MFIGKLEVDSVEEKEGEKDILVKFKNGETTSLRKTLYNLIATEKEREGSVEDCIRLEMAKKIITQIAEYGLDIRMVEHVLMGVKNLSVNFLEEAIGEKFGVKNSQEIKVEDVLR